VRSRRTAPPHIRRIGIIQPTAIGDLVLSSGLIAGLRAHYPDARLILLHGASNAQAVALLATPMEAIAVNFKNPLAAHRRVHALQLDLLIDLCPWPRITALVTMAAGARYTVGFDTPGQHRQHGYDLRVPHRSDRHELLNLLAVANALGVPGPCPPCLKAPGPAPDIGVAVDRLILFHTSAGGSKAASKAWPSQNWVDLAQALIARGYKIGLTGAPAEVAHIDRLGAAIGRPGDCLVLAGRVGLPELCALLASVPLTISVDTAVVHLAAAVDGRVLALHGPTSSQRWGPCNARSFALDAPHPAAGHISLGFESHELAAEVMPSLTVVRVLAAALAALAAD